MANIAVILGRLTTEELDGLRGLGPQGHLTKPLRRTLRVGARQTESCRLGPSPAVEAALGGLAQSTGVQHHGGRYKTSALFAVGEVAAGTEVQRAHR